jgi:3-dehydroquinate dehydratase/shikimate dehydrogenase
VRLPSVLCVTVAEPTVERALAALRQAGAAGASAELRLDHLREFDFEDVAALEPFFRGEHAPAILTCRRLADGGIRSVEDRTRLRLLVRGAQTYDCSCDLEYDLSAEFDALGVDPERLVLSHHDFERTPEDLERLFDEMTTVRAAVYKIATFALRTTDLVAHAALLARARAEGRRLVALAMGPKGVASRILGPAAGAPFTFCALGKGREAAPGQPTLDDMQRMFRAERLSPESLVTGLVGGRVDYSLSPAMQNAAFDACGFDGVYVPYEVDDLARFLEDVVRPATRRVPWRVRGLSVTNPFKTDVLALLDHVDPFAAGVGAVNTIVVDGETLAGFNTDVAGAIVPLERAYGPLEGVRAAVVGAGGAARAVAFGLRERGARVTVFARREERAAALADRIGCDGKGIEALGAAATDILVNTTPVGTRGPHETESPVPSEMLRRVRFVYDLVYNPAETRLLAEARAAGAATLNGLPMLVEQAAHQFELWTGRTAPREAMAAAVGGL